jgi:Tfp pilus assembly protein PilN
VIRANLSTRPFYNERAVHVWLTGLAILVAAATIFNVTRVLRYSQSDTRLASEAQRDEARAADLRKQAAQLRASVDPRQLDVASASARQANELIDRRTFSWTDLFNRFETTLPDDVRVAAVRPIVDKGSISISIAVVARSIDDVNQFIQNLEGTGAFAGLLPVEDHFNEQGLLVATLKAQYVPGAAKPVNPKPGAAPPADSKPGDSKPADGGGAARP